MFKSILILNMFLSLIYLGVQHETKEFSRLNVPLTQVIPAEILENILKYNEKSAVKSKVCDKNTQFRLSDEEDQILMPSLNKKITKGVESRSDKVDNIILDYSKLQKLRFVNNSNNQNLDQYREIKEFQTISNILLHELSNNESIIEVQDENFTFVTNENEYQIQNDRSDTKRKEDNDNLNLPFIASRHGHTQTKHNNADSVNERLIATPVPEYIFSTKKSAIDKTKSNRDSISNITNDVNNENYDEEDIPLSSESNEVSNEKRDDSEITNDFLNNRDIESLDNADNSNNLNKINKQLELRNGKKITEISDSRILLESHRICYACVSSSDPSCLKPNRQTAVKYCYRDNTACVTKSYTIGRSSCIMRDCGSSCISADINSLAINYETCSICHTDLCNSAHSINIFIAPSILLLIVIKKIIY